MNPNKQISLCITTHNRVELTLRSFAQVIDDPRIGEVVIMDDGSDRQIAEELREKCKPFEKVAFFGSNDNQGVYRAKKNAITLAFYTWAILLDSDNVIGRDYIDTLYSLPDWDIGTCYLPDWAKPTFDYRQFSGITLTKENIALFSQYPMFDCLINTMNGFYNKTNYMATWENGIEPLTADSMYMNYLFLKQGYKLEVVPGLQYDHTIHDGSHYKLHSHKNIVFRDELLDKFKALH